MNGDCYQVGVFPVTEEGKIVLVTTRSGEYWIFPKGCREKGRSDHDVASDEAYEEAGLTGKIKRESIEFKVHSKRTKKLRLFPMKVEKLAKKYPESDERKRITVSFEKAEKLLQKDLKEVVRKMKKIQ